MSMPAISIGIGSLLTLLGVGSYVAALAGMTASGPSPTALIPAFVGIPLIICGAIVSAKPHLRKHVMHAAATIGLLGMFGAFGRAVSTIAKDSSKISAFPVLCQLAMGLLCLVFVVLCVKSFIDARKARTA